MKYQDSPLIPGFPPKSTAPPIEANDHEYDPYYKEDSINEAV